MVLLWLHAAGIACFALLVGYSLLHSLLEASVVAVAATVAGSKHRSRGFRSGAATLGLVSASAILVHVSGGLIEMHFHFFVMIAIITLYQDWLPFLLALGYVVVHHGTLGTIDPQGVYNHPAAWSNPWRWALIHAVFVLGASIAHLTAWRLNEEGFQDPLTGLANRTLFEDRVSHAVARADRTSETLAVLFLDLDDFKTVNDSLGHVTGDEMLVAAADRLKQSLRTADTAARLGGDEFAVLLEGADAVEATMVAERILDSLRAPLLLNGKELFLGASIGIAANDANQSATELLRNADAAMYAAKQNGKGRHAWFQPGMHAAVLSRLELQVELRGAVERGEFVLHYQPTVRLDTGRTVGLEALLRWHHPRRGLVSPAEFIPLAEATGAIVPIGQWVLVEACRQVHEWNAQTGQAPPLQASVNLSTRQLQEPGIVEQVADALAQSGLDPQLLVLEITESVLVRDPDAAIQTLGELKDLGVRLAIDDFGTGYSSLSYLHRFPLDILKIDKSFVDTLTLGSEESALTRAMVQLGPTLGLQVTAEGVETADQVLELEGTDCDFAQGFYFSKPLAAEMMQALLDATPVGG